MKTFALLAVACAAKVQVQLLFESECPFCQQFITTQLKNIYADDEFKSQIDVDLVAYGNAQTQGATTQCQHGPTECHGNIIENCLEKYAAAEGFDYVDSVICMESANNQFDAALPKCVPAAAAKKVAACAAGPEGGELQKAAAKRTGAHDYVPWLNINGKHDEKAQDNLQKVLCGLLPNKPKACTETPAEDAPLQHVSLARKSQAKVQILFESECPGCQELITTDVKKLWADKTVHEHVSLELIAYGNAQEQGGKIECQHGATECFGNKVENCLEAHAAAESLDYPSTIVCVEAAAKAGKDFKAALDGCVAASTAQKVLACANGAEGAKLQQKAAKRTPDHDYVPWVIINGEHKDAYNDNFIKAVCDAVNNAPAICKQEHEEKLRYVTMNAAVEPVMV